MKGNHKGETARALPVFLQCAALWHAFVLQQAFVLQHVFGAPQEADMGTWHKLSLPGMCCKQVSSSDMSFEKQKKKRLTHASKPSLSSAVRLSFDRSMGSCCKWPINPEPVKGVVANSSSRRCIDRFWFGRFLATVTGRGPL